MLKVQRESELDQYDFMMWRPVLQDKATFYEVAYQWTLNDLMDCLEMLDIKAALEEEMYKKT